MKRDPRVTQYIAGRAPFARPLLASLRSRVHAASPKLEEALKWGSPTFLYQGKIVCGIAGFKAHCALWFWRGKTLIGKKEPGAGMGHFGRIASTKDLPPAAIVKKYVRKRMQLIDQA